MATQFSPGSGWSPSDPEVKAISAAVAAHAPEGTKVRFGGTAEVEIAAVDRNDPHTIVIGPKGSAAAAWVKGLRKDDYTKEMGDGPWLIPEARTGSHWDYIVAHESGHVAHLAQGNAEARAKDVTAALRAVVGIDGPTFDEIDRVVAAGMSGYGAAHPYEAIAEAHAAWSLAGRPKAEAFADRPAIAAVLKVMGWA